MLINKDEEKAKTNLRLKPKVFGNKHMRLGRALTGKVLIYCLLILILFSLPSKSIEKVRERSFLLKLLFSDAVCHLVSYGGLAFIVWWDYSRKKESPLSNLKIFIYCFLYSFLIEVHQGFLPWRSFEMKDLFFNATGICITLFVTGLKII